MLTVAAASTLLALVIFSASRQEVQGQAAESQKGCWPGIVRYVPSFDALVVCGSNGKWISSPNAYGRLRRDLVGHWKMDEQSGNEVADDSGFGHHGTAASVASPTLAKFTRGRSFDGAGSITVPAYPGISFGQHSFVVAGWAKIQDVTYPRTTFAVLKGFGCYLAPGRSGWTPGWEIGHGYRAQGTQVCIRDYQNNMVNAPIIHDPGYRNAKLLGKWTHYAVVFDRVSKKIRLYINGKKQSQEVDISSVTGSVDNNQPLTFGTLYGWQTDGTLDEYRLFNNILNDDEIRRLYLDHHV